MKNTVLKLFEAEPTSIWGQCGWERGKIGLPLLLFPTFRALLWSGLSWHVPYGRQPQPAHLAWSSDHFFPLLWWCTTLYTYLCLNCKGWLFFHALIKPSRSHHCASVHVCFIAKPHPACESFFFFLVITAGESLQLLWLEGNECVCCPLLQVWIIRWYKVEWSASSLI